MMDTNRLFQINKDIPVPLYYQIKQSILTAIKSGELKGGDMLPTELEYCQQCDVSRPTVRQAYSELVSERYLYRLKGKGTFVSEPKIDGRFLNKLQSFNEEMRQKGMIPSTKVLKIERIKGDESICGTLQIPETESLIRLERLRYADGEPVVYLETFLPYQRFSRLMEMDFTVHSLYQLLEEEYNDRPVRVVRELEAVIAMPREAELLNLKADKAICLVRTVAYTEQDKPVEYSVARYRGEKNKFRIELYR